MRAVVMSGYGGPEVLELVELDLPALAPDAVRVRAKAASLNRVDVAIRQGYLQAYFSPTLPVVLGLDVAGVIEEVGSEVSEFAPGDEVVGYLLGESMAGGGYAEVVTAAATNFVHKPATLDFVSAAAVPHTALTADQSLHEVLNVKSGETLLLHAAAGGVGSFAVQLARRDGVRVLGTALPHNAEYLRSLGAEPVRYDEGLLEQVRALAPDGVDAVLDLVGGEEGAQSVEVLREGGRLASAVDFGVTERGGTLVAAHPDRDRLAILLALAADGELRVQIAEVVPLERLADAQEVLGAGHVRGKVIVDLTS